MGFPGYYLAIKSLGKPVECDYNHVTLTIRTPNTKDVRLLSGDLFSGAGGLSAGFHTAGFTPAFFNDIDLDSANTFQANFPSAIPFVGPIQELSASVIRERTRLGSAALDVMIGGPPCQGFSINAPIRSQTDPRNNLFHHYVRLVLGGLRPNFVVMENVPGLVSFDGGKTLENVLAAFEKAGYRVVFKILNAAHYGVPQERWRLVFLGTCLPGIEPSFPLPTHYSLQRPNFTGGRDYTFEHAIGSARQTSFLHDSLLKPTTIGEAISDLPSLPSGGGTQEMNYSISPKCSYQEMLREGAKRIFNHECAGIAPINIERITHVKPGGSWRDIPHKLLPKGLQRARRSDHTKRYGRLDPAGLSGTILTKCDPHWGTFFHYAQDRIISVREAARLQSFPDWFKFTGSKVEQYRQVGNAVPPLLARALAEHIKTLIKQSQRSRTVKPSRERSYAASQGK
jgi:DNA (cytosine-5)-methyltransferase 1